MRTIAFFLLLFVTFPAYAERNQIIPGPVIVYPVSVYDGDTFTADAHTWPGQYVLTSIRVLGIDTPEIKGKCASESKQAKFARDYVKSLLDDADVIEIKNIQNDKYGGRVNADVFVDGKNLAKELINKGLARPYDGGKRKGWC